MYCNYCKSEVQPAVKICPQCGNRSFGQHLPASPTGLQSGRHTPVAPMAMPSDPSRTDSTRYLCAAAYLNKVFRDEAIARLLDDRHSAVAGTPGVDLPTVLKHCLDARRRRTVRDLVLAGLAVAGAAVTFGTGEPIALVPFVVAAWGVVCFEEWSTTYRVIANRLSRKSFDPRALAAPADPDVVTALERLSDAQDGNVMTAGGFSPFPGSGLDLGGWSFVVDLRKGKEEIEGRRDPHPVAVEDLYGQIAMGVRGLGVDRVEVQDKLCVNGKDIRDDERFLPDPYGSPVAWVDPVIVKEFIVHPSESVRHYSCIRVVDWKGELVLSVFLRLSKVSERLFIEISYFLLTPVAERYHQADSLGTSPTPRQWLALLTGGAVQSVFLFALSPLFVAAKVSHRWELWKQGRETRRRIAEDRSFNYGATTSVREAASDGTYRRYFQKLDKEMHQKILERTIIDGIIDFLDARDVDTSDLRERKTTILNSGVIVSGGAIDAQNLTVGTRARAVVTRIKGAAAPTARPHA